MDRETRTIITKFAIGCFGVSITVFGYFVVDRDVEIRKNIAILVTSTQQISIQNREISIRIEELGKRVDRAEEAQRTRGERISRLEALIERLRDRGDGHQ